MKIISLMIGVFLYLSGTISTAHHSRFGVYNSDTMIEIEAVLTNIKWSNPHVQLEVDVTNSDGVTRNWIWRPQRTVQSWDCG